LFFFFFFQAEDGIRDVAVTGVQTCALPICREHGPPPARRGDGATWGPSRGRRRISLGTRPPSKRWRGRKAHRGTHLLRVGARASIRPRSRFRPAEASGRHRVWPNLTTRALTVGAEPLGSADAQGVESIVRAVERSRLAGIVSSRYHGESNLARRNTGRTRPRYRPAASRVVCIDELQATPPPQQGFATCCKSWNASTCGAITTRSLGRHVSHQSNRGSAGAGWGANCGRGVCH